MTEPKCVQAVRAKIEALGGTLDYDPIDGSQMIADSASGYLWEATSLSIICWPYENWGGQTWLAEACKDMLIDLKLGCRKATEEEAEDIRHSHDDDTWGR